IGDDIIVTRARRISDHGRTHTVYRNGRLQYPLRGPRGRHDNILADGKNRIEGQVHRLRGRSDDHFLLSETDGAEDDREWELLQARQPEITAVVRISTRERAFYRY